MSHRRLALVLAHLLACTLVAQSALGDINPQLTAAVSRRSQGGQNFDIALPLTGNSGVECRRATGALTLLLTFDQPVTGGSASVSGTSATTQPVISGSPTFSGNTMTVNVTNALDLQEVTLTVTNVTSAAGGTLPSASVLCRLIEGDVNGNGTVTSADINITKAQAGIALSGFNFREDINMNAALTSSDVNLVKARSGKGFGVTGPTDTAPTIGAIADQTTNTGTATVEIAIGDAELSPSNLAVTASSDNLTLVPKPNYQFNGSGATRTMIITSAANQTGVANVTVTVGDGLMAASTTFQLTVAATPHLYLAFLQPVTGVSTLGSGTSWLTMDGDETAATIRLDYSNLTTPKSAVHVHEQGGAVLFDFASVAPQKDGSYRWVFAPVGGFTVDQIVSAIKNGQTYVDVHSNANPTSGELRATYGPATTPYVFVPPPAPPSPPSGSPTQSDAARFLMQATFGPTALTDITNLQGSDLNAWIDQQMALPATQTYPVIYNRCTTSSAAVDALDSTRVVETWWKNVLTAPDQLRQRVATALSEIFVVSNEADAIAGQPAGLATYYDMLAADAFGNFRTLLGDVTLHPIMGQYLNMRGNKKPTSPNFTAPNENYAREVMQLFSIGLNQLQPDGTLKLDTNGVPIPTYDQNVIIGFAHVFTGWDTDPTPVAIPTSQPTGPPINVNSYYNKPMVVVANGANHSTNSKLLLNGQVIPATGSQTSATATAELNTALDNIFNHPNVGAFISRELIQRLVTSTPSPAYVYRVAQIFNNDGTGVRGNMKAVIKAILLDYEARTTAYLGYQGYGHLREPLLRYAQLVRAFHPTSTSGYYKIGYTDELTQTIFDAPTVFNFFEPYYSMPGEIDSNGLWSPEFQITSESANISSYNLIYTGIYGSWKSGDVKADFTNEVNILNAGGANGVSNLLDYLNTILMANQMTPEMKTRIVTYVNTLNNSTTTDKINRVRAAVHLVITSAQYSVQK